MNIALVVAAVVLLALVVASIRIVREYQRVVVFRLGRLRSARGPGLVPDHPAGRAHKAVVAIRDYRHAVMCIAQTTLLKEIIDAATEPWGVQVVGVSSERGTLTLRTLQTLAEVATEHNSTRVLPIPIEILDRLPGNAATNGDPGLAVVPSS